MKRIMIWNAATVVIHRSEVESVIAAVEKASAMICMRKIRFGIIQEKPKPAMNAMEMESFIGVLTVGRAMNLKMRR